MSIKNKKPISAKQIVLVEIGNDWLKLVQVESAQGGIAISRMHLEKFDFLNMSVAASLADACKRLKIAKVPVVACLPRQLVNIRILELPSVEPDEIADMLELQIGKQTPYSKDEIISGYRTFESDQEGYTKLLLAIVQRNILRERYDVIEAAGLEVGRMTISSEGILNWCVHSLSDSAGASGEVALLDIDSFYSDFSVVIRGSMIFTRSIMIGANQLLNEYDKWKEKFAREVKLSLESCATERGVEAGKLLISGASSNVEGLSNYLGQELGVSVEVKDCARSLKNIPESPSLRDPKYRPVSITPLVGMAMDTETLQFNLIPDTIKLKRELLEKTKNLTLFVIFLMTFLVMASMYGILKLYLTKNQLSVLTEEVEKSKPDVQRIEKMKEMLNISRVREDTRLSALNLISEINNCAPEELYFDKMNIDIAKGSALIEGTCGSIPDIRSLVGKLEQSPLFRGAQQVGTAVPENRRLRFTVSCLLEKQ